MLRDQLIVVDEDLALALAHLVQARAHRDRADPPPQVATPGVLADLAGARRRARRAATDEQPLPHELLDVRDLRRRQPHARERDVDLADVVAIERLDRPRRVVGARAREIEIGGAQALERGIGELGGDLARDERDHVLGIDRERGPRGAPFGDQRREPIAQTRDRPERAAHVRRRGIEKWPDEARRRHRVD